MTIAEEAVCQMVTEIRQIWMKMAQLSLFAELFGIVDMDGGSGRAHRLSLATLLTA